jgi:heme/copper-type cytochrome/quinol oxidase subunit 3
MSTLIETLPPPTRAQPTLTTIDDKRGTAAMMLTITTETSLFLILFFAYFYLARGGWRWLAETPPKLTLAFLMLGVLAASSLVLMWGERQVKARNYVAGRLAIGLTILMGLGFLAIQVFEYKDHLKTLTPQTNVYGSIFYTITTFHAAHVVMGLLILSYVLILPRLEPVDGPPHRPYHNAVMYWHFVDVVWIFVVAFLYVAPNIR